MQFRFPWLITRKRLALAVTADIVLIPLTYTSSMRMYYSKWPNLTIALAGILILWVLSSYVFGRYHAFLKQGIALMIEAITTSIGAFLICLPPYFIYYWSDEEFLYTGGDRPFVLYLLLLSSVISCCVQLLIGYTIGRSFTARSKWLFVGSPDLEIKLRQELVWCRMYCEIYQCYPNELQSISSGEELDGVIVSSKMIKHPCVLEELLSLQDKGVKVVNVLRWCELVLQRLPPELIEVEDFLHLEFELPQASTQLRLKRLGDIIVSIGLLLLTGPVILTLGLIIIMSDGGPALYSQIRNGHGGKAFRIWKLRSMCIDAEKYGARWSTKNDPRVTWIGRFMRITRLDELPQLVSVLSGDMSLIGPRPERPEFENSLAREIPYYVLRHRLKPGLSGWSQVNYYYGASIQDAANKLSYDLYYLRNFSIWLDMLILVKTIKLVFNGQGSVPEHDTIPNAVMQSHN
jgi:exopolysaccharide biosynthesis polyprenyl glycosylphosphotransferase